MSEQKNKQQCCCCCGQKENRKEIMIDYFYLDLNTCDRCVGTDAVLEDVLNELSPAFALAG